MDSFLLLFSATSSLFLPPAPSPTFTMGNSVDKKSSSKKTVKGDKKVKADTKPKVDAKVKAAAPTKKVASTKHQVPASSKEILAKAKPVSGIAFCIVCF